jgi:hypothetical protein
MLPRDLGDSLFPNFVNDFGKPNLKLFRGAYISKQANTLDDNSTTLLYDESSTFPRVTEFLTNKTRVITSTFTFGNFWQGGTPVTYLGFGRVAGPVPNYLLSYLDVRELDFVAPLTDRVFLSRTDEVSTNETAKELWIDGVLQNYVDYRYLPTSDEENLRTTELRKIYLCGEVDGNEVCGAFDIYDLAITKTAPGVLEFSGFPNYYIEDDVLYPADDLYPDDDIYPTQPYTAVRSVKFEYEGLLYNGTYPTGQPYKVVTYVNIPELDFTYNDGEFKILWKCDRG